MKLRKILSEILTESNINDNFKRWFGSSKVKTGNSPKIVYHGSANADIQAFSNEKIGSATDSGMFGRGFYFTDDEKYASTYANRGGNIGKIYAVYLSIKNPLIIVDRSNIPKINVPNETLDDLRNGHKKYSELFTKWLEDNNYDGVFDYMSNQHQYVALYPEQIKSVDNNGEWSLNTNDITK